MHNTFPIFRRIIVVLSSIALATVGVLSPSGSTATMPTSPRTVATADQLPGRGSGPGWGPDRTDRFDLATIAISTPVQQHVQDEESKADSSRARDHVELNTAAVAATRCDGCSTAARSLHLVDIRRAGTVGADNVAQSHAGCAGCSADSLSIQVVLAPRSNTLVLNNQADATTLGCDGCTSTAMAIQIVVVGALRDLSPTTRYSIEQLMQTVDHKPTGNQRMPLQQPQQTSNTLADRISGLVTADTGGTAQRNVSVDAEG
ncbi:MAG: hypothetical protein J2P23_15430 [Microlunatus sp.]|nr:hypothetical protein [Microlunatus sp.]